MTLNDRISKICKDKKVKQIDLVNLKCGSKQTVNQVLHGKQTPNSRFLEIFLSVYKDVNARWLLTGEESMLLEEPPTKYGFCRECIKKEGVIEHLKKECAAKDKRIEELLIRNTGTDSTQEQGKKTG